MAASTASSSEPTFDAMVQRRRLLSSGRRCTATATAPRARAIEERMASGADVVLEIDYQGALQIKKLFANAVQHLHPAAELGGTAAAAASAVAKTRPR